VTGRRSVTILGATGSVGRSTLDLIERDSDGGVRYHYTLVDFTADAVAPDGAVAGDDAEALAWFRPDALQDLGLWAETLQVIELAAAARRPGAG